MDTELISEAELDDRLHKCDPVDRAAVGSASFRAVVAELQRNIESGAGREAPSQPAVRSFNRRRWVTLGTATAAVAIASLVGVETLTGGSGGAGLPLAVPSAAAAQLNRVAHAASAQPMPGGGQWEYLEFKLENTGTLSGANATLTYSETQTLQNWYAPDGDARQRITNDSFSFATPQDRATYLANRSAFQNSLPYDPTVTGAFEDKFFPSTGVTQPVWVTSPPSDAQTLITEIWNQYVAANGPGPHPGMSAERPEALWEALTELLLSSTSQQLRATAYRALAYVPYTTVLGAQTDQLGRSGIAISFTHDSTGTIQTLMASPATGDLLELDRTMKRDGDGIRAGTVIQREIFLRRAIVAADVGLPGGGYQPFASGSQTTATPPQTTTAPASQAATTTAPGQ